MSSSTLSKKDYIRWQKAMVSCRKIFRCHQLASRSFSYKGMQFPLCARCTGILIGLILIGPLITCLFPDVNLYVSISLILIMVLDGLLQLKGILMSNNARRLLTGLGFGYGVFSIFVFGITFLAHQLHGQ